MTQQQRATFVCDTWGAFLVNLCDMADKTAKHFRACSGNPQNTQAKPPLFCGPPVTQRKDIRTIQV